MCEDNPNPSGEAVSPITETLRPSEPALSAAEGANRPRGWGDRYRIPLTFALASATINPVRRRQWQPARGNPSKSS